MAVEQIAYELDRDVFDLWVCPSQADPKVLIVKHVISGRHLLTVPPILPEKEYWVGVAGAAVRAIG